MFSVARAAFATRSDERAAEPAMAPSQGPATRDRAGEITVAAGSGARSGGRRSTRRCAALHAAWRVRTNAEDAGAVVVGVVGEECGSSSSPTRRRRAARLFQLLAPCGLRTRSLRVVVRQLRQHSAAGSRRNVRSVMAT